MKRQEFIKTSLMGLTSALVAPSLLTACGSKENPIDKPILIIGAGIAGLSAAKRLKEKGFTNITILEGRDRTGGRIHTDRSTGNAMDLGASWIHGPGNALKKNPITNIAEAAGAVTFVTDDNSIIVKDVDGTTIPDTTMDALYADYNKLLNTEVPNVATAAKSLKDAITEVHPNYLTDPKMVYQLSAYAEFDAGGAIEDLSSLNWADDEMFPGDDVLFPNGYDAVVNNVAQGLTIKLNTKVTKIDYNGENVIVSTSTGEYTGAYLVVTLPLGILKAGDVAFSPALPSAKTSSIQTMQVGHVNKVVLKFPSQFWGNEQYIGYCSPVNQKGMYNYFMNCNTFAAGSNTLVTFGFGTYGLLLEGQTNAQIQQDIMDILKKMYGSTIPNPSQILVTRWTQDAFAKGSYSFASVGVTPNDYENLAQSVNNKLFFAGEHTHHDYRATVHGAYLSGEREADKIYDLNN
jgi:monoamine oxidase